MIQGIGRQEEESNETDRRNETEYLEKRGKKMRRDKANLSPTHTSILEYTQVKSRKDLILSLRVTSCNYGQFLLRYQNI
jgi:hypothetical protein